MKIVEESIEGGSKTDFPQFGSGGATQVITHSNIKIDSIIKLPKK